MEELVQLLSNTVTGRVPTTVLRGGLIYGQRVKQFHPASDTMLCFLASKTPCES